MSACATSPDATPVPDATTVLNTPTPTPSPPAPATQEPVEPPESSSAPSATPARNHRLDPRPLFPSTEPSPPAEAQAWMSDPATAPGKVVFLTFDDGPNNVTTPRILDILAAADVDATFFVVGSEVPQAPEVLRKTVEQGNRIALHSVTHDYDKMYPGRSANAERAAQEFDGTLQAVRDVLGADFTTTAWRYPGGHMSWDNMDASDKALADRGATWVDWNALTGDAEPENRRPTTSDAMVSMATQPVTDGYKVVVLLAHDSPGKDLTVDSLPRIIEAYRAAGYTFATLS